MKTYRAVVIGCGPRSGAHIQAYEHIADAEVVACCDLDSERLEKSAAEHSIKGYSDAATMIDAEKPDMVHIVTPPNARVKLMTLVSEKNVPLCTVEKPIATGVADWRKLCQLEANSKTRFALCHQFRWYGDFVKCCEAVQSGRLGELRFVDMSAGMNISGQGTHILNYAMALNAESPVVRVFGMAHGASEIESVHPAPDDTAAYLTFANGARALWCNGSSAPRCGDPKTVWQHVRVGAYAERGRVEWQEFGKWQIISADGIESGDFGGMDQWRQNNLLAQSAFHQAMFDWLADDAKVAGTNLKQSLHEWKVVLGLYASAVKRKPIDIAEFDPPDDLFEQLADALRA